jgi:hypothetical protein
VSPQSGSPVVSVVMPVHNGERFLAAAIDSILAQTFTDFELIAVDDGSVDGSAAILESYAARDARVRVARHASNQGAAAARNHGCRLARGRYIAVMDADDVSLPGRLARQVAVLDGDPSLAGVGSWVRQVDESGTTGAVHTYPEEPELVAWSMVFFNSIAHPTLVIRRDALPQPEPYASPVIEDYALLIPLTIAHRIRNLPEVLLLYRVWRGNTTHRPGKDAEADRVLQTALTALGLPVPDAYVAALRGLSVDRYLDDPGQLATLAATILEVHAVYVARLRQTASADTRRIDEDAAVRLWMVSALAARRGGVATAATVAVQALRLRPRAALAFARRVLRRVTG